MVLSPRRRPAAARPAGIAGVALLLAAALLAPPLAARGEPAAPPSPAGGGRTDSADLKGEVTLSLADYLQLELSVERADQARARDRDHQEPQVAAVVAQRSRLDYDGPAAEAAWLESDFEVQVQGRPLLPVALPVAGTVVAAELGGAASGRGGGPTHGAGKGAGAGFSGEPAVAAALHGGGAHASGLYLLAAAAGRYTVHVRSRVAVVRDGGTLRIPLPRAAAQVAVVEARLPAALAWDSPGAVAVEDRVQGDRRLLRLSAARGAEPRLEIHRTVAGSEAEQLLVQDVVTTFLQVRPEGVWRHDVVLYEVARGELGDVAVDLPAGLTVERAGTDEGPADPIVSGNHLVVHRRRRLHGTGFLVVTSRPPAPQGTVPLGQLQLAPAPRARYLAVAADVAGQSRPLPAAAWMRVDLDDLPAEMHGALAASGAGAAWRLAAGTPAAGAGAPAVAEASPTAPAGQIPQAPVDTAGLVFQIDAAPRAALLATLVRRRDTTTLLTVDGTLLHRDRFELAQAGATLDITLPPGATLWSAAVDGAVVRPLERAGSGGAGGSFDTAGAAGRGMTLSVPLGGGAARMVEVVAVAERVVAAGRSQLALELAQVQAPVVEHRWQVLLPENARYRFRAGDLRPVVPTAAWRGSGHFLKRGAARDEAAAEPEGGVAGAAPPPPAAPAPKARMNAGGNEGGQGSTYAGPDSLAAATGATVGSAELKEIPVTAQSPFLLDQLRQGLVGGVRPLPVTIPQTGKSLILVGLLPPPLVRLELETQAARR